jgi:type IV secretion system protein VirB10
MNDTNNPPPNDPYNPQPPQDFGGQDDSEEIVLQKRGPSLSGGSSKTIFGGILLIAFVGFMLNSMFGNSTKDVKVDPLAGVKGSGDAKRVADGSNERDGNSGTSLAAIPPPPSTSLPSAPAPDGMTLPSAIPPVDGVDGNNPFALPELPPIDGADGAESPGTNTAANGTDPDTDIPPPPPPLTPPVPQAGDFQDTSPEAVEKAQARMRSNIMVMDANSDSIKAGDSGAESALDSADPNRAFASNAIKASRAPKVMATRLNNLSMTIAQGKIINAVLENAVNTDLPGNLRAIVSRDVYPEAGRSVLIPKGSRLIGTYNTGITRGQKRVMIVWTRLIRPDGLDIEIGSPAIDSLGRAGVEGFVDNKFTEIFSSALLTTALTIGAAKVSEQVVPGEGTTTNNTDGSSTSTSSPSAQAAADAVKNLGDIGKTVVENMIDLRPTITIDQGTRVNVFVNRDLTFPDTAGSSPFVH